MSIQEKAKKVLGYFTARTRDSGESFHCLTDAAPDAIRGLVMEAHGTDMFPDDFRYEAVVHALDYFSEGGTLYDYDPPCGAYISALLSYLGSGGDRLERANEALAEGSAVTVEDAAMLAQHSEALEVACRLAYALDDLDESE